MFLIILFFQSTSHSEQPIATKISCTKTRAVPPKKYVSEQGMKVPKL